MVPKGWEVKTLEQAKITVTDGDRGKEYPKSSEFFDSGYCLFLSAKNVTKNGFSFLDTQFISKEKHTKLRKGVVKRGDIVLTTRGSVGQFAYYDHTVNFENIRINSGMVTLGCSNSELESDFFYALSKSSLISRQIDSAAFGSAQPQLTVKIIKSLKLPVPPLPEQQKIAKILSTWDKAISTTERLIENSNQQKKALMQQLLAGKKRLLDESGKRFEGEWEERKLSNLGSTFNGLTGKTKVDFGSGKKYIPYMNIFKNTFIDTDNLDYVNVDVDEKQNTVQFGDVFFTTSSETPEEVGMSSVLLKKTKEPIYLNSFCFGFRLFEIDKVTPAFIGYILRSSHVRRKIAILAQGATRYNLSKVQLLKISIALPSLEEQQKIATVLTNADKEIGLLEQQLADLQQEKKALMQVLLTGKKRVVVDGEVS
ncbi:restriction endonuclease subunit S [uncultured Psychrobacter sp.]|uniref:restriction endonuclease subunit S n=1 Tax=uncultured Psychrobacter sp. TaxID=259303 RepID=UPI00345A57E3